ncbi:bacillibactin ABC transporter integral membrane protein [Gracilibacillus ureilyticus]|uniref:Bacillibactin ABC transporter integral membrane protein n=1 Tax=Gracilibacillus ureilyticus TaxID=531814 RepID=A0A1H9MTI5_9BACI|nr:iron ABC transporter permease [Gracilibacillus ureilyticus]SER26911.1 bacillibactin ABC transporter integral membrane protein [Gracilibacillus ureilyticus]
MSREIVKQRKFIQLAFILLILLFTGMYVSLTHGEFTMTISDVIRTLIGIDQNREHQLVIFEFRLPRVIIALFVGLGLGIAGAVIQALTRNELADPGILGINAGAGVAVVIYMYAVSRMDVSNELLSTFSMPFFGLIGGTITALFIYGFSWTHGRLDSNRLLLVGIAAGSGLGAISLYISLKMNPQDFEAATMWMTGTIWNANWNKIISILPWFCFLLPIMFLRASHLDLFYLGEDTAKNVGVSTEREKSIWLLGSVGLISACVSVSGSIGFIGLLSPHIARSLVGLHHRKVLAVSGLIGMVLVTFGDFIAKTVFSPVELPVGVVIAIIGIPYFIYLLKKKLNK